MNYVSVYVMQFFNQSINQPTIHLTLMTKQPIDTENFSLDVMHFKKHPTHQPNIMFYLEIGKTLISKCFLKQL